MLTNLSVSSKKEKKSISMLFPISHDFVVFISEFSSKSAPSMTGTWGTLPMETLTLIGWGGLIQPFNSSQTEIVGPHNE